MQRVDHGWNLRAIIFLACAAVLQFYKKCVFGHFANLLSRQRFLFLFDSAGWRCRDLSVQMVIALGRMSQASLRLRVTI